MSTRSQSLVLTLMLALALTAFVALTRQPAADGQAPAGIGAVGLATPDAGTIRSATAL